MKKPLVWKEKASRKKWLDNEVDKLMKIFFLEGWSVYLEYNKYPKSQNSCVDADVAANWSYRRFTINVYPQFWNSSEEDRVEILIHEFCHVLVERPFELLHDFQKGNFVTPNEIEDVNEHTTTWIATIICKQYLKKV